MLNRLIPTTTTEEVQTTTLGKDVLSRFVCNTWDEAKTNPYFDFIVVGSGMYGGYLASRMFEESRRLNGLDKAVPIRVLVLEAGPFLLPEHGQNVPALGLSTPGEISTFASQQEQDKNFGPTLVWGLGWKGNCNFPGTAYCVGGKSLYWGGWCPRLTAEDLAQWPAPVRDYMLGTPGDSNAQRLRKAKDNYEAVEYQIGVKPTDDFIFDPVLGETGSPGAGKTYGLNAAMNLLVKDAIAKAGLGGILKDGPIPPPIAVQTQSFISGLFSLDKYSSLPALIRSVRTRRSPDGNAEIFVVPNAHVVRLDCGTVDKNGAAVPGYRVQRIEAVIDGKPTAIDVPPAGTVVLAMGTIETTRLALESFPTAADRAGKGEIMGRNLAAHLRIELPFRVPRKTLVDFLAAQVGPDAKLTERPQTASLHIQGYSPNGRFHFQFYSVTPNQIAGIDPQNGDPDRLIYNMVPDPEVAASLLDFEKPDEFAVVLRMCGEMKNDVALGVDPGADPNVADPKRSWIDLAAPIDSDFTFGHRRAYVHYQDGVEGLPLWEEMVRTGHAMAEKMGAVGLKSVEALLKEKQGLGTTWHDSGTLWTGVDPDKSVTDENGRFHHVMNVAVADQSLFPTVGSANPVLTGLTLARKVADSLVQRHRDIGDISADLAKDKADGFEFLLDPALRPRWKSNDGLPVDIFDAGTGPFLEVRESSFGRPFGPLAVAFYDDPALFGDFELRFEYVTFLEGERLSGEPTANSGVFLRAPRPPAALTDANFYDKAVEIQIDDTGYDFIRNRFRSPRHRTGAVYGIAPACVHAGKAPASFPGGTAYRNRARIVVKGNRIETTINGYLVSEATLPAGRLAATGFLAFQYHTGKIQFHNIRVKR